MNGNLTRRPAHDMRGALIVAALLTVSCPTHAQTLTTLYSFDATGLAARGNSRFFWPEHVTLEMF
jgi:hypothetical protein